MVEEKVSYISAKGKKLPNPIYNWFNKNPNRALIFVITLLGFFVRLFFALSAKGIYHPDEIFQSLEMAHLIVYDSGYTPPEFQKENLDTPSYAASRSWLFPLFFAMIMQIGELFGLEYHTQTLPLIRIVLAINSTLLIPVSRKFVKQLTHNETAGVITAIFIAVWWRLIELTVRSLSNTFFLPLLFYGLYRILIVLETNKISNYDHFIISIFVGLTTYIRLDLGIVVFAIFIITFNLKYIRNYLVFLFDGIMGWTIGLTVDYSYYDRFFTVPVNWLTFAIQHGDDFEVFDRDFYWVQLVRLDGLYGLTIFSIVILVFALINKIYNLPVPTNSGIKQIELAYIRLFMITLISWLISSSVWDNETHKEIRFNTSGLVLLLMTIAVSITLIIEVVDEILEPSVISFSIKFPNFNSLTINKWKRFLVIIFVSLLLINQSIIFQSKRGYIESFDDINMALEYVGQQANVTGVIMVSLWYLTGAYTYLHLDNSVPIEFVNLTDEETFKENKLNLIVLVTNWELGNFVVLPSYQILNNEFVIDLLFDNNFSIVKMIDGRTEVWKRN